MLSILFFINSTLAILPYFCPPVRVFIEIIFAVIILAESD